MNKIRNHSPLSIRLFRFDDSPSIRKQCSTSFSKRKVKNCHKTKTKDILIKSIQNKCKTIEFNKSQQTISRKTEKKTNQKIEKTHSSYLKYKLDQKKIKVKKGQQIYKPFITTLRPKFSKKERLIQKTNLQQNKNSLIVPTRTIQKSIRMKKQNFIYNQKQTLTNNGNNKFKNFFKQLSLGSCSYRKKGLTQTQKQKWVCSRPWSPNNTYDSPFNLSQQEK